MAAVAASAEPKQDCAAMSIPPEGYGIVEAGIYRASTLKAQSLPFVANLKLKTLLHLSPRPPLRDITDFLDRSSIQLIHLGAREGKPASWKPMSENMVKDALEITLDANVYPIMITCTSGVRKTGIIVGCLRRLQKWNLTSIIEEYRRYASNKAHYANEQFMELFDEDLVTLPKTVAPWFLDQQKMMEEEEAEFLLQLEERNRQQKSSTSLAWPPKSQDCKDVQISALESCSSYARYYYYPSCPLTTEDRYRKQRAMRKTQ